MYVRNRGMEQHRHPGQLGQCSGYETCKTSNEFTVERRGCEYHLREATRLAEQRIQFAKTAQYNIATSTSYCYVFHITCSGVCSTWVISSRQVICFLKDILEMLPDILSNTTRVTTRVSRIYSKLLTHSLCITSLLQFPKTGPELSQQSTKTG